ncbi:hypothetical protein H6G89_27825 [Oscillatoria sp. FACHB-1407]|nr:hypothetical protein [Oscillatoria sp. FACHB-1407]
MVRKPQAKAMAQTRMPEKLPDSPPPSNVATAITSKKFILITISINKSSKI